MILIIARLDALLRRACFCLFLLTYRLTYSFIGREVIGCNMEPPTGKVHPHAYSIFSVTAETDSYIRLMVRPETGRIGRESGVGSLEFE